MLYGLISSQNESICSLVIALIILQSFNIIFFSAINFEVKRTHTHLYINKQINDDNDKCLFSLRLQEEKKIKREVKLNN